MGVTETLRILPTIFLSAACIQNVRLFGVYVVRWPFLAEIHTAPLKRFVPSSVIQAVRALRNAPASLAVFLAGVAPVLMTACISKALMCHDLWDADHCARVEREPNWAPQPKLDASVKKVTSVSLAARGKPCRTAGDAHQATSDRTHWGTVIRLDQLPVLWHHAVAAHHWTGRRWSLPRRTSEAMNTNMPRSLCRSLAVMFGSVIQCWWTEWTLRRIFGRGTTVNFRVLNCIPMNSPGSLDWGLTSRSWWSSRENGAHWRLSGRAVWPVPEYLLWSASRLSRRVASHLAALTMLRQATTAWWTLVEKSPTRRGDKWTGTLSCWPRNVDTCGRPGARNMK